MIWCSGDWQRHIKMGDEERDEKGRRISQYHQLLLVIVCQYFFICINRAGGMKNEVLRHLLVQLKQEKEVFGCLRCIIFITLQVAS